MKNKYMVGQKVRILSKESMQSVSKSSDYIAGGFVRDMFNFCGKTMTIKDVLIWNDRSSYRFEKDTNSFIWDEKLIEGPYMKKVELPKELFEI